VSRKSWVKKHSITTAITQKGAVIPDSEDAIACHSEVEMMLTQTTSLEPKNLLLIRQARPGPAITGIGVTIDPAIYCLKQILCVLLRMTKRRRLSF
jgi:hypothetical protein